MFLLVMKRKLPSYFCEGLKRLFKMPSILDNAKRSLVKLLKAAASTHGLQTKVTRDSTDREFTKAFRTVSLRAHPDKGGNTAAYQALTEAYDAWQKLVKDKAGVGRPRERSEQERPKASRSCGLALCAGPWFESRRCDQGRIFHYTLCAALASMMVVHVASHMYAFA